MNEKKGLSLGPLKKDHIRLSGDSIFYTLQGEGPTIGTPVLFMRLHECNLKCVWCDAWYTWNKETPEYWSEPEDVSIDNVINAMVSWMSKYGCSRWVFTGGEPLMQKDQLQEVLQGLPTGWANNYEIETNGTIKPTEWMMEMSQLDYIQFNCSPKTSNSNNKFFSMHKPEVLKYLATSRNSWFKFVVAHPDDVDEIRLYIHEADLPKDRIILMPEGTTQEAIDEHAKICDELCKANGWRLTPRLQITLYGDARAT